MSLTKWPGYSLALSLIVATVIMTWSPWRLVRADVLPPASQAGFPHPVLYGSLNGVGQPLVDTTGGPVNPTVLQQYARWPVVILPPTPLSDRRPDLMAALRAANPNQKIFAYVLGHVTFCTPTYEASVYYRQYWETVEAYDNDIDAFCDQVDPTNSSGTGPGFLWWQNGSKGTTNVNLAHRIADGLGGWRYDLAEDLATLIAQTVQAGDYDGVFFDLYCDDIMWQETGSLKYDYQRAGYGSNNADPANRTAFRDGWAAGHAALAAKIRSLMPDPNFPIMGNCAQSPTRVRTSLNGWMQENFPNQNGGTWVSNMYGNSGPFSGYLADDYTFLAPQHNFLFTGLPYQPLNPNQWSTGAQQQRMRFGLASAALGNGFAAFEDPAAHTYEAPYQTWWSDEYAVDRATGQSSTDPAKTGWLGQATSEPYQSITPSASPNLTSNGEFESNTSGWQLSAFTPAAGTLTRVLVDNDYAIQATTSALGVADYYVNFSTTTTFPLTNGQPVSITFWAKASSTYPINLILYQSGTEYGRQSVTLTPTWKQYQVTILATATVASANLRFDFGTALGTVTMDSIEIQAVAGTNVYRRDFQYGTMLLNSTSTSTTVTLDVPYRKISGTVNPTLNDGSVVAEVTLQANDAVFLLSYDGTPPAAVNDLRPQ